MEFGKTKLELKVGVFVFTGLVLLAIFILSIGRYKTWASGYRINFIFNFANGVKVGAPVRFAGIDVGEVKRIDLVPDEAEQKDKVLLNCWVKSKVRIPVDSTVWVNTLGLLGEKYVEIMPGKNFHEFLAANQTFTGIDPIPMHEVFRLAHGIVVDMDKAVQGINRKEGTIGKLLYDDSIYQNLDALILDIRKNPWKLFFKQKEVK